MTMSDVPGQITMLPASVLPGLLEIALKSRLNVQALFERAGIDADAMGRADHFVSLDQLDALLSTAFGEAEDPFFGLRVGQDNHYSNLDLLGNLLATAGSLYDALQCVLRFKDLIVPYLTFELSEADEAVEFSSRGCQSLNFLNMRAHNEVVVATIVAIGRSLVGGDLDLRRVSFRHAEPEDTGPYDEFFAAPIAFDQPCNAVEIGSQRLHEPLPTAFPKYHQRLTALAEQQLQRIRRAQGITGQVLSLLQQASGGGASSVEQVAARLNLTARTLQRRLRAEGVTFAALRDQTRHQRACELLAGDEEMAAIAEQLGFSDTANFYHAFKRWQGCTPGAWRRQHRNA
jgi:AraC-like DNA-binding protein